jgi:hypothetical protein
MRGQSNERAIDEVRGARLTNDHRATPQALPGPSAGEPGAVPYDPPGEAPGQGATHGTAETGGKHSTGAVARVLLARISGRHA